MREITYWVIRHIPTKRILATADSVGKGRGNTRVDIQDTGLPRLFETERRAKYCLARWLEGKFHMTWEDGIEVSNPAIPRIKEDMEIIPVQLKVMV